MGKKSLFESTVAPEKDKKNANPDKAGEKETAVAPSSAGPEVDRFETPAADFVPLESDPLIGGKSLLLGVAGVCGLILMILIASMMNADNYYVKQARGAVEIWKGDFSPIGKDCIMILHGTQWNGPFKESYSKKAVFSFAVRYYLKKTVALVEAPVSDDFNRIVHYLDRARELVSDLELQEIAAGIDQAGKNITEARVLQSSGEKAAVSLAQEKLDVAGQILAGILMDLAVDDLVAEEADSDH